MASTNKKQKIAAKNSGSIASAKLSTDQIKNIYHEMLLIRRFEEKAGQLYGMGLVGGFCHLYIGQEAVVTGISSVQEPQDTVVTSYRDHAHMLACDMDPNGIMAELTGRIDGYSRGKGGSMHMFSLEKNFFGGHGIVGAGTSIGAGLGFAHKYKEDNGVAIAYMGDGASNQGQVAECYNMAALWNLPILFVIENNQYGMGTNVSRSSAGQLYRRGEGYGIPGEQVDGMDVLVVRDAAQQALNYIRSGNGAYILEMMTYRYRGHSMSDPAKYRTKEEVASMKDDRDPIVQVKNLLLKQGMKEEELKAIDKKIKTRVGEAATFAQESPEPPIEDLWTDILVERV